MRTIAFFLLAMICLFMLPATHEAHSADNTVRLGTLNGYAPYCFTNPPLSTVINESVAPGQNSRILRGYSWDVVRESLHSQNLTILLTVVPWSRTITQMEEGKVDILFPAGKNTIRLMRYAYSKKPVNSARKLIYTRTDSDLRWNGLNALNNVTIAALRGFNYGDQWEKLAPERVYKYNVNTIRTGLRMLHAGRVDGFAGYEANWDHVIRTLGWEKDFAKLPVFNESFEYCIALLGDNNAQQYLDAFDRGLEVLQQNGTIETLRKRWHIQDSSPSIDKTRPRVH